MVAEKIKCGKIQFNRSISDHKLISLEILNVGEVPQRSIKMINRKLKKKLWQILNELQNLRPSKMQNAQKTTHTKNL